MTPRGYPAEFRRRVIDLVEAGRRRRSRLIWGSAAGRSTRGAARRAWLSGIIGEVHAGSRQTYGANRVHAGWPGGQDRTVTGRSNEQAPIRSQPSRPVGVDCAAAGLDAPVDHADGEFVAVGSSSGRVLKTNLPVEHRQKCG